VTVIEGVPLVGGGGGGVVVVALNTAPTLAAAFIVTVQEPVPLHAPLQPAKVEPVPGVAARVTTVPCAKLALQVAPQLKPAGELVTVPLPVPLRVAVSEYWVGGGGGGGDAPEEKFAVTLNEPVTVSVHEPLPEHAPLQPVKVEPLAGKANNVTTRPDR
jgi:hypothetical protein